MRLKSMPTIGTKISPQDEMLIDRVGEIVAAITDKYDQMPFTEALVTLTGIIYGLIEFREDMLTSEDAGFESEHDLHRFNYLLRLMKDRWGYDIPEIKEE